MATMFFEMLGARAHEIDFAQRGDLGERPTHEVKIAFLKVTSAKAASCGAEQRDRVQKDCLIPSQMAQRQQWQARNRLIEERARVFGQEVRQDREQFIERREAARRHICRDEIRGKISLTTDCGG
jgi:hypothetical protein